MILDTLRRLVAPLPSPPEACESFQDDFTAALLALCEMHRKCAKVAPHSPRHATLAARYDQAIRLLLADSQNIRTEIGDAE